MDFGINVSAMSRRVAKLARNLAGNPAGNPGYILPYLQDSVLNPQSYDVWSRALLGKEIAYRRRQPVARRYPWFAYAAHQFLDSYLKPDMRVFEWGAGNSTLFFALRCASVRSVENDETWYRFLQDELRTHAISNAELVLCQPGDSEQEFERSTYLNAISDQQYDVIVVDGYDPVPFALRPYCFYRAQQNIAPGGIIIVDDSWRYQELRSASNANSVKTFESIGPGRLGVTSTDVYFY